MHPCGGTLGPTCKVLPALPVKDLHRPGAYNQSCCLKQVQGEPSLWGSPSSIQTLSFFLAQTHHSLLLGCQYAEMLRGWVQAQEPVCLPGKKLEEREQGKKASQVRGSNRRKWTSEGKKHPKGLPGAKASAVLEGLRSFHWVYGQEGVGPLASERTWEGAGQESDGSGLTRVRGGVAGVRIATGWAEVGEDVCTWPSSTPLGRIQQRRG